MAEAVAIRFNCHPLLRKLIGKRADDLDVSMSDFVAHTMADAIGRSDLRDVPKDRPGRPRSDEMSVKKARRDRTKHNRAGG